VRAYQEPEVYVKRFVGRALSGIPHVRLKADYGAENVVIEAKSPLGRAKDREQVKKYIEELHAGLYQGFILFILQHSEGLCNVFTRYQA
jgi:hypothetical protein